MRGLLHMRSRALGTPLGKHDTQDGSPPWPRCATPSKAGSRKIVRMQRVTYLAIQPVLPVPDSFTYRDVPAPPSRRP